MTLPLLDTRKPFDAGLCGYDGSADPLNSSNGLIVEYFPATATTPACVQLLGPEGVVDLLGLPEIREVAKSLAQVVAILESAK